jgi:hypothetical protein
MWNSTAVISAYWGMDPNAPGWGSWRPQGKVINATGPVPVTPATPLGLNGYQWNKTIPKGLPGSVNYYVPLDVILGFYRGGTVIRDIAWGDPPFTVWAISVKPGEEGRLMFNKTYPAPPGNTTISIGRVSPEDRVFTIWCKEHRTHYCYSLDTGELLWGPTEPEVYLGYLETWSIIYDGKLYTHGTKGIVDCYDVKTGKKLWSYEAVDPYTEIKWSNNWIARIDFIVDGKIYIRHSAHSDNQPLPRGAPYICLNATTGEVIWRVDGLVRGTDWGGRGYIGDSIIVKLDTYDLLIFALGKGPSATTVSATPKVVANGQSIVIEGTVMDVSPGTKDSRIALRFPNGVPAVADESMGDWMLYVYKQFPRPANVKGVWVTFDVIGPDGKWTHIGGTHTDASGMFSIPWTPPSEGLYTIVITFPGSKSYYPSYARTTILVEPAPPTPQMPEIPTPPDYTMMFAAIIALVVIAILIGVYSIYDHRKLKK